MFHQETMKNDYVVDVSLVCCCAGDAVVFFFVLEMNESIYRARLSNAVLASDSTL